MHIVQRFILGSASVSVIAISGLTTASALMVDSTATPSSITATEVADDVTTATLSEAIESDETSDTTTTVGAAISTDAPEPNRGIDR